MSLNKASVTMQAACAAKASDQTLRELDPVNTLIYQLLPQADEYRTTMDQYSKGMFTHTVCFRKKFFAQLLNDNADKYSQLIVLCGGLDFSCLANAQWKTKSKFFIDHPLSLELSLPLLEQAGIESQAIEFIGLDLASPQVSQELQTELLSRGFDFNQPTLVLWEGATYYIEKNNVIAILEMLAKLIPQLKLAFDFVLAEPETTPDEQETQGMNDNLAYVKKHNEPWQSKFFEEELSEKLRGYDFQAITLKTDKQVIEAANLKLDGYRKMFGFLVAEK